MWREIKNREMGKIGTNSFFHRIRSSRISSLQLSNHKDFVSPHRGAINSLQVDLTEGRYMLSGASDGSAAIFDVQRPSDYGGGIVAKHKCLFVVDRQHEQAHKHAISSAVWYPIDTGLFITGSYDHYINVWDTNTTQVIMNFKMPGKVYRTAMSSLATSHMLIAAGSEDVQVRLCDIASGAFAHTLSGHRDGVMTVEWSKSSEWVLVTGGCDGAIRFWDIRRAGCFRVLDQSKSQVGRRQPLLKCSSEHKASTSKVAGQSSATTSRGKQKKVAVDNGAKKLTARSSASHTKVSVKERLHPGLLSIQDRATAHYGAVTGLKVTEDGMYLLSAGSDSRVRLWDIESGCNTLVNYETARLQNTKPIQLAVAQDSSLVLLAPARLSPEMDPRIWGSFPEELLEHVLCFLPTKTALNFRSTCKRFKSFIFSTSFLSKLRSVSPSSSSSPFSSFLVLFHPHFHQHFLLYDSVLGSWRTTFLSLNTPSNSSSLFSASCNGLLCFSLPNSVSFLICNLLSQSSKVIRFPSLNFCFELLSLIPHQNGFKIFAIPSGLSSNSVFLYSSKTESWNSFSFQNHITSYHKNQEGICFDGFLYFTTSHPFSVVKFDLESGKLGRVEANLPDELVFMRLVHVSDDGGGENKGKVYMVGGVGRDGISRSLKLWEMEDGEGNWVEMETLPELMYRKFMSVCYHNYEHLYCFWHQGSIVLFKD
ncbi:hypothetical protein V2J09_011811 [Rumex salicifolius]